MRKKKSSRLKKKKKKKQLQSHVRKLKRLNLNVQQNLDDVEQYGRRLSDRWVYCEKP